jgi:CheY-like chemotaxis protein
MLCNGWPKGPRIPLSQDTVARLHDRANELRQMAANTDQPRLRRLADRYDEVAIQRTMNSSLSATDRHCLAEAARQEIESWTAYSVSRTLPPLAPTPAAQAMAAEAIGRRLVVPQTGAHPAIHSAIMNLAYLITAYGMVPNTPVTDMRATRNSERTAPSDQHLLLVDDAPDVLVSVGAFLMNAGFVVRKTASGDDALAIIASDPRIEVLVTDFAMPGLNGAELIAQATQIRPDLKTLVITGYPNADGLNATPLQIAVLAKPFRRIALINMVRSLFDASEAKTMAPVAMK